MDQSPSELKYRFIRCLSVFLAGLLSGCQLSPRNLAPELPVPTEYAEYAPEPLYRPAPQPSTTKKSGNNPIIPRIEPKSDLLYRLRQRFSLPQSENSAVRQEIEWFAAHPDYLDRVFGRAERYLFYITEELEKRKMPSDLALLPIIESAYDPFAYSHGRAAGLWQIIPGTADQLGLTQNWWYDARRDVVDSTRGALDYLQQLHEMFQGDWLLAIAAYNSGAGNVTRALRRASAASEPTDFWHIKPYLPLETRAYIPRLLAIQKLVASPESYGVTLPSIANEAYFEIIDTGGQMDMTTAMELAGISGDQLYLLNPGINRWATNPDGPHRLLIPTQSAKMFLISLLTLGERDRVRWTRHKVVSGETLSDLALRYQTTPKVLSEVNNLENDLIRADEHLMIPHAVKGPSAYIHSVDARTERKQNQPRKGQRQTHLVQQGESLWTISKHYKVGIRDLAIWNAMAPGDLLREGRRLVVWTTQPTPSHRQIPQKERIRKLTYVVRKGDSLSGIGNRFRVTIAELLKWNNISTNQYLQPGQQLVMYVDVTKQST